jgi:ABC-type phosphonate transport system ATPase subunit
VPSPAAFLPAATSELATRARTLMMADLRATTEPGRRLLARHGIAVREGAPTDALARLLAAGAPHRRAG